MSEEDLALRCMGVVVPLRRFVGVRVRLSSRGLGLVLCLQRAWARCLRLLMSLQRSILG